MMFPDLRAAVRLLGRHPGFATTAILSLAVGIALTTAVYGMVDALQRPYVPFANADRLFRVSPRGGVRAVALTGMDRYRLVAENIRSFDAVAMASVTDRAFIRLGEGVKSECVLGVTQDFVRLLGVQPMVGQGFSPGAYDNAAVVMISEPIWRAIRGEERGVRGLRLVVEGRDYDVIGVLPNGVPEQHFCAIWRPVPASVTQRTIVSAPLIVARLRAGVSRGQAEGELRFLGEQLTREYVRTGPPITFPMFGVRPDPFSIREYHVALIGASIAVLLIACLNLSTLLLARGIARRHELSVRAAIGASRRQLVRQLVAESAILAFSGGIIGLVLAWWLAELLRIHLPAGASYFALVAPHMNWRVFVGGLGITAFALLVFAVVPAWQVSLVDPAQLLKAGATVTGGITRPRYRVIVALEVALAMMLMLGATLLVQATRRIAHFDLGYDYSNTLVTLLVPQPVSRSDTSLRRRAPQTLQAVQRIAGVEAAATRAGIQPSGVRISAEMLDGGVTEVVIGGYQLVTANFFDVVAVRRLSGRLFLPGDGQEEPAVVVDSAMAKKLWPLGDAADAIGRMVKLGRARDDLPWVRVLGVTQSVYRGVPDDAESPAEGTMWVVDQNSHGAMFFELIVRPRRGTDFGELASILARRLPALAAGFFTGGVNRGLYRYAVSPIRGFMTTIVTTFAVIALALAIFGIFSVLNHAAGIRAREFAIRVAVGATNRQILRLVVEEALSIVLAGIAVGALAALWATQLLRYWLFGIDTLDVVSLVVVETLVVAAALVGAAYPAWRASRINPASLLRAI